MKPSASTVLVGLGLLERGRRTTVLLAAGAGEGVGTVTGGAGRVAAGLEAAAEEGGGAFGAGLADLPLAGVNLPLAGRDFFDGVVCSAVSRVVALGEKLRFFLAARVRWAGLR